MITSSFNTGLNILETTFKDEIYANEVLDYILDFRNSTSYPKKLKGIIDATSAHFKFSFEDLKTFNNAKTESLKNYELVIMAIIINNSFTAAISTLYQAIASNKKYKFKVFSTHEAALLWLETYG